MDKVDSEDKVLVVRALYEVLSVNSSDFFFKVEAGQVEEASNSAISVLLTLS